MFDQPTVITDLDGVLFDYDTFHADMHATGLREYGIAPNVFQQTREQAWSHPPVRSGYSLRRHAEALAQTVGRDSDDIYDWLASHHERTGDYVFPDAHLFLHELRDAGCAVVLLTFGDPATQTAIVRACGFADDLDAVYVTRHPKQTFLKEFLRGAATHDALLFVNDNPEESWTVAHVFPRMAQALRRNLACHTVERYDRVGFPHFGTLDEIREYAHAFFDRR